ncbi:major facilitator superfamily domain-containing protein 6-like isoform X2 [Clytia hemisphaerica]|uniref:Major facilitator superfamily associated domain-containing protein n=1 Tax=Clytia hemisphaerica TaxID=252671 RepID=A0A7M5X1B3_9CNID|eukprot:TCONS_00056574-protein
MRAVNIRPTYDLSTNMGIKETLSDINADHPLHKAKAFYFLFDAAIKTLPRHLGMYYKHTLLLSPHQVAMLLSVRPFLLIFGSPVLGGIADKTNKFRHVMLISLLTFLVTYVLVPLVEPVEGFNCKEHVHFNHSANHINISTPVFHKLHKQIVSNGARVKVEVHKYYQMVNEEGTNNHQYDGNLMQDLYYTWPFDMYEYELTDDITQKVFNVILLITIFGEFFASPSETFADLYTLRALGSNHNRYGWQIISGLFGFFIVSIAFAASSDIRLQLKDDFCHVGHVINYSPYLFVVYGLVGACILIAATFQYRLFPKPTAPRKDDGCNCDCNFIKALPVLAETPAYTAYAIAVIFCGFACGVKQLYIYHYLTELGGPHQLIFVVLSVHFISGFLALLASPYLLERFGASNLIAGGLLLNGISFVVYSLIKNPWLILIVEPFHGLCQELSWVAIVTYAGAPPQIGAALQGTVHGLHKGLGLALGYYAVCVLILKFGYVGFFLATGLLFFVVFGFYLFVIRMYPKEESIADSYSCYSKIHQQDVDSDGEETVEMFQKGDYNNETLDRSFLE